MNRNQHPSPTHPLRERGSALLVVVLVSAGAMAATLSLFSGRALMEQRRAQSQICLEQAAWRARGEVELARVRVAEAAYVGGRNQVLRDALDQDPPLIPGTGVVVEEAGPPGWYRLAHVALVEQYPGSATTFVREGTSYAAYNYYVEDHDLGVSGEPRGQIHTNKKLEIYFPDAKFDDLVSSGGGFSYLYGASEANSTFQGGSDPAAEEKSLLDEIDMDSLKGAAIFVAPAGLDADVRLKGEDIEVSLYEKGHTEKLPYLSEKNEKGPLVYQEVTKTKYKTVHKQVDVKKSKKVWIPFTSSSAGGGTDIGGGSTAGGYWKTEYYYVKEWKDVKEPDGTYKVWEWVQTYVKVPVTKYKKKWVPGELVQKSTFSADGIFYFEDRIRSLKGQLNGNVTLVSDQNVKITGTIQYVDGNGETAYLNGLKPSEEYIPNPDFERDHALGVIAKDAILYSKGSPNTMEINASLISIEDRVGFEGIKIDASGKAKRNGGKKIKTSLRRSGSIMCAFRPMATLLNSKGQVETGFKEGASVYDRSLLANPPPGYPTEDVPSYLDTISQGGQGFSAYMSLPATGMNNFMDPTVLRQIGQDNHHVWEADADLIHDIQEAADGCKSCEEY